MGDYTEYYVLQCIQLYVDIDNNELIKKQIK